MRLEKRDVRQTLQNRTSKQEGFVWGFLFCIPPPPPPHLALSYIHPPLLSYLSPPPPSPLSLSLPIFHTDSGHFSDADIAIIDFCDQLSIGFLG